MTLPQKKAREILLLLLYSQDVTSSSPEELEELIQAELKVTKKSVKEAEERLEKILEYLPTIDLIINRISTSYDFAKIHLLEKNILRLGAYEILYDADIPPKVGISEAVRLATKFSTPASSSFVNAILDSLYKESIGKPIDHQAIVATSEELKDQERENEPLPQGEDLA
jgi:N utilization substance protein B